MIIREAKKDDILSCVNLTLEAFDIKKNIVSCDLNKKLNDKDNLILITEHKNTNIAFAVLEKRGPNKVPFIDLLVVKKKFRNKKIGTVLLNSIKNKLKGLKVKNVLVEVESINPELINFYLKNEFKITGYIKDYFDPNNDAIILSYVIKQRKSQISTI